MLDIGLQLAHFLHQGHHGVLIRLSEQQIDFLQPRLFLVEVIKGLPQDITDRQAWRQDRMLVQIAGLDPLGPENCALIGFHMRGNHAHEGRFALTIRPHQADMLTPEQPERHILKNGPVAKAMTQPFYCQ